MSNKLLISFSDLDNESRSRAGGKGGTLGYLYQAGYPIPDGFVIMPSAFEGDDLLTEAWSQIKKHLARFRKNKIIAFAVRSSALAEDSAQASFGGQFETVLNVSSDEEIHEAILTVRKSRLSKRVQTYSHAKGLDFEHEIAVVIQQLVRSDISGVLFTKDPVTGRDTMIGNYVHGLGDKLVSGDVDAKEFSFEKSKGHYNGPNEFKKFAKRLFKLSKTIEKKLGLPQDIEWAVAGGKVYILQSRPITTLIDGDPITFDYNSTRIGDYLWVSNGGPYPEPMTPSSWSVNDIVLKERNIAIVGEGMKYAMGNVAGVLYLNYSFTYSLMRKFRRKHDNIVDMLEISAGLLPEGVSEIPHISISLKDMLFTMIPNIIPARRRQQRLIKNRKEIITSNQSKCETLRQQIKLTSDKAKLISLWEEEVKPLFSDLFEILDYFNDEHFNNYVSIRNDLRKLIGNTEANALISSMGGGLESAESVGISLGLTKIVNGEMTKEEYILEYGHRHANENELAVARPYEDPNWLDEQLKEYQKFSIDVQGLMDKREADYKVLWQKFASTHPKKALKLEKKIDTANKVTEDREKVRSEMTRAIGVIRDLFLRAGELTDLGEDVFFVTYQELLSILKGDESAIAHVPARKETFEKFRSLPQLPNFIRGRFDPFQWVNDPNRRTDYYDSTAPIPETVTTSDTITGAPGSAGRVEGIVRLINSPEEGDQLQQGEILLATTTNIGWTTLFPRAAAIITDIGASLAHAAIVARELGIPAVVGCGNATMRLKTGDRVRVDGGQGLIKILETF
ncbi:MAG: PEP/pyruvate-binding domain-containing protein [Candidatus Hodarchaeales archaeon]